MNASRVSLLACSLLSCACLLSPTQAAAIPVERGFQIPLDSISNENLSDIKNTWKANVICVHIGNNSAMDGTTGAAYDSMMEERFALL